MAGRLVSQLWLAWIPQALLKLPRLFVISKSCKPMAHWWCGQLQGPAMSWTQQLWRSPHLLQASSEVLSSIAWRWTLSRSQKSWHLLWRSWKTCIAAGWQSDGRADASDAGASCWPIGFPDGRLAALRCGAFSIALAIGALGSGTGVAERYRLMASPSSLTSEPWWRIVSWAVQGRRWGCCLAE